MSDTNEKQALVEEIQQRIKLLVSADYLSEPEKVSVLREALCIIDDAKKEEAAQ